MRSRFAYPLLALLAALVGAAAELAVIASARPWLPALFQRAALELAAVWLVAGAGVTALRLLTAREPALGGAWWCAPIGWLAAQLVVRIDPNTKQDSGPLLLVGALALAALLFAHRRGERWLARVPGAARATTWLVLLPLLLGVAEWRRRDRLPAPPAALAAATRRAPSVVWISLDTLRADRLGCYGNGGGLTPNLDALAREGVLFETLTCPMPLTAPSHTAMLTGLPPHESGVTRNGVPLATEVPTLPRLLSKEGYATAGFVSGFPLFQRSSHYAELFDWYDDEFDPSVPWSEGVRQSPLGGVALRAWRHVRRWREPVERPGDRTIDRTLAWLADEAASERPFFLFVHLYDAHGEYLPHQPGEERAKFFRARSGLERIALLSDPAERAHVERLYDGEVRFVDAQLGRLFAALRAKDRFDDALVVVTSDHGESLGEHSIWYEHVAPWNVEIQVPALLKLPKGEMAGTRVRGPAQTADLAATALELIGAAGELPGASLAGAIERGAIPSRLLFCQSTFDSGYVYHLISASDGRFKLIHRAADWDGSANRLVAAHDEFFDLATDPGETRDLIAAGAVPDEIDLEEWRQQIGAYYQRCLAAGQSAAVAEDVAEQLRQLGYGQ